LQEGFGEVIWVDSDIVVHHDVITQLVDQSEEMLCATQETYWGQRQGGIERTVAWGLRPGRDMPFTINSGVLRVTAKHIQLLQAWQKLLGHPVYIRAQALPWQKRPLHMISDQEVLTALLGAEDFSHIPFALLERGVDIAQCFGPSGFTPWERIKSL